MKKIILLVVLTMTLMVISSVTALAGSQDFTFVNKTGFAIYELHISPQDSDSWEEDILKDSMLDDGEQVKITFNGYSQKYWDIMIKDKYGNKYTLEGVNLNSTSKITIYRDGDDLYVSYN